ncbi:ABC transporter ATP-binding protein [Corynebacterium gerontici]|uniref:Putative siderophore transport system ATP-binding protein YusV n=1 Tax=Corynebacterium gerontici TaxID=2079234 RepID=A0A3G6IZY9_9CORY|nr:ABC transporter ATP-binding protein [Corynebacterium gerontici]AZA11272.1 putative siderophore transport system ATP-binding protein YusV [Corynebacterium gerontici]
MTAYQVSVQGVGVGFGQRIVVNAVEFQCEPATVTAIVGTNGVGKTTLLRGLAGVHPLAAGKVELRGGGGAWDVEKLKSRQKATMLAMVSQEEALPEDLTVKELVTLGRLPYARAWELSAKKHESVIDEAIETCGLTTHADTPCGMLSGGLRRRALIARGFAQDTPVLFLDEPTNHLDTFHQLRLLELLRASSKTVILTLHDLDLAMGYADQVVVLEHGEQGAKQLLCAEATAAFDDSILQKVFGVRGLQLEANNGLNRAHLLIESLRKDTI